MTRESEDILAMDGREMNRIPVPQVEVVDPNWRR